MRIAVKLVIFLLLGAVVNVGVAWGCAAAAKFGPGDYDDGHAAEADRMFVFWWQMDQPGVTRVYVVAQHPDATARLSASDQAPLPSWAVSASLDPEHDHRQLFDGVGLPMRSLACGWVGDEQLPNGIHLRDQQSGRAFERRRALPLRPILPGFAINTVLYAAILFLLWFIPFEVWTTIRHWTGHGGDHPPSFSQRSWSRASECMQGVYRTWRGRPSRGSLSERIGIRLVVFLLLGAMVNVGVAWGCAIWTETPRGGYVGAPFNSDLRKLVGKSEGWSAYRYDASGVMRIVAYWWYQDPNSIQVWTGYRVVDNTPKPPAESLVPAWAAFVRPHGEYTPLPAATGSFDRSWMPFGRPQGQYSLGRYRWMADARGWPALSMWGGAKTRNIGLMSGGWAEREAHPIRAILIQPEDEDDAWSADRSKLIPLAPIWPGFVLNSLFYAAILWLMCVAPLAPFRVRRYLRAKRGRCIKCGYDLRHAEHKVCPECGTEAALNSARSQSARSRG